MDACKCKFYASELIFSVNAGISLTLYGGEFCARVLLL